MKFLSAVITVPVILPKSLLFTIPVIPQFHFSNSHILSEPHAPSPNLVWYTIMMNLMLSFNKEKNVFTYENVAWRVQLQWNILRPL